MSVLREAFEKEAAPGEAALRETSQPQELAGQGWRRTLAVLGLQLLGLFAFWIVLSGRHEAKYLILGALSAGLVVLANGGLRGVHGLLGVRGQDKLPSLFTTFWRSINYVLWLLFDIFKANVQLAYVVLHPRMPIDPALLQLRTRLDSTVAQVVLANSITLTPGTVTIDLRDGTLVIHALVPQSAESLIAAEMQNKVGAVFGEGAEQPPKVLWAWNLETLRA
jgi:multicomponent Na+:H+ antiporter subunit E